MENEDWDTCPDPHGQADLTRCIRRIAKLMELGLTGQDLILYWIKRRIQPLQHRERLMHQYMGPLDSLRVNRAVLTSTAVNQKMRRIVKVSRNTTTYEFGLDMFTHDNKCPKVVFPLLSCFPY